MLHKWLEEWFDMLLFIAILTGTMVFFLVFWKEEFQTRYAEVLLQEFLTETAVDGKIQRERYENLIKNVMAINPEYEIEISCVQYELEPVYALLAKEDLVKFYMERNVQKDTIYSGFEPQIEEEDESLLQFQEETNATILAAEQSGYLSLPEEQTVWSVEAVRPVQEVYEGERLITLCRITSPAGSYYMEAEPMLAACSGMAELNLWIGVVNYRVPIEIICYPRTVRCKNGHKVVNSKTVVESFKETGNVTCSYCFVVPEQISCNVPLLVTKTGTELKDIWIDVTYLDGHTEQISPMSEEWVDSYDENFCGIQPVTIWYRGEKAELTVVSENEACQQCGGVCNERCYTDYIRFPYCVRCMSQVPLFTGKTYEEEKMMNMGEMVRYLDEYGEMEMKAGQFVVVSLMKRGNYITCLQKEILQNGREGK